MDTEKYNLWQRAKEDPLTTIIGFAAGGFVVLQPVLQQGQLPTLAQWILAGFMALVGMAGTWHRR